MEQRYSGLPAITQEFIRVLSQFSGSGLTVPAAFARLAAHLVKLRYRPAVSGSVSRRQSSEISFISPPPARIQGSESLIKNNEERIARIEG